MIKWVRKICEHNQFHMLSVDFYGDVFVNCLWMLCEHCDLRNNRGWECFLYLFGKIKKVEEICNASIPILRMFGLLAIEKKDAVKDLFLKNGIKFMLSYLPECGKEERKEIYNATANLFQNNVIKKDKYFPTYQILNILMEISQREK